METQDESGTDEKLRQELESERRRVAILDSMIEGVAVVDPRRRITFVNDAQAFLQGYDSPGELVGCDWQALYPSEELERIEGEILPRLGDGGSWSGTCRTLRSDGRRIEQHVSFRLVDGDSLICTCRDSAATRRAERALRHEQSRLRSVVSSAPIVLWALDADGVFTLAEGRETSAFGVLPGELVGKSVFVACADIPQIVDSVRCALLGDTVSHVTEFGGRIFASRFCPVKDAVGTVHGVIGVATDVSKGLLAQHTLRETIERLQSVISHMPVVLWSTDADGRFTLSEGKGLESLGLQPGEVVGRSVFELYADAPEVLDSVRRVLAGATFRETLDVAGRTYETLYSPLRAGDGAIAGVNGISIDITERRKAELALQESEEKYRAIFDAAAVSMWEHDIGRLLRTLDALRANGVVDLRPWLDAHPEFLAEAVRQVEVLDVNTETLRMFAAADKAEILRSADRILGAESLGVVREALIALHDGRESFEGETVYHDLRGRRAEAIVKVVFPRRGTRSPRMLVNVVDITQRVRAEEQRRNLERQVLHAQKLESLGVLAGGIAHDFNNILTGILGNAELALFDLSPESATRERMQNIISASSRAAELCRQMLAYSGKGKFQIRPLNVNRVVREMTSLLEASISKVTTLRFDLDTNLPLIDADPAQIRQVAMNLITNASESFEERSGTVTVATGSLECDQAYLRATYMDDELPAGQYVYLDVCDTGPGMDRKTRAAMFDPFFTTKFTGRGLGLAATLGIVRGHRGAIAIDSEPGRGTRVRVLFPESDGREPLPEKTSAPARSSIDSRVVLIVDDEASVRDVGRRTLERAGYEVLTAADGLEGVEVFRKHQERISVVVLDLTMPRLGGEEALRRLWEIRDDVRVILTSGYNEAEATQPFTDRSPSGFIQKPFSASGLLAKLDEILEAP